MKALLQPCVIFSAYRSDRSPEQNYMAHKQLVADLDSLHKPFTQATGMYAGVWEESVIIPLINAGFYSHWVTYAGRLGQESVLVRNPDGSCYLVFTADHSEHYIDQWREVSTNAVDNYKGYTKVGSRHFVAA